MYERRGGIAQGSRVNASLERARAFMHASLVTLN